MSSSAYLQYNSVGLLPEIMMLTLCDYIGEPFQYNEEFLSLEPMFHVSTSKFFYNISPETQKGLDAFIFFLK